jgi:N-acetylmuramoyl-L-alanine amidase
MTLEIIQRPLPYVPRLESRCTDCIKVVVIHCTELPDVAMARVYGEKIHHVDSQTGNSGHFYIDRDGSIEQWVPLDRIAHHVRGFNAESIGIELVNLGRYPHWYQSGHQQVTDPYPDQQIDALASLLNHLVAQLPGLEGVTGHEDLDTAQLAAEDDPGVMISRKVDPGPLFPWATLMDRILQERLTPEDL